MNDTNLSLEEENDLNSKILNCIEEYDLVVTVDYGHGFLTEKIVNTIQNKAKFLSVNTQINSFNLGYHTISKYRNVDYVCVHEGELRHDYRNK